MLGSIEEHKNFLIAFKGIQNTVPLKNKSDGTSLLEEVALEFPQVMSVFGKNPWEGGALHRLDFETTGAVLFAKNQKFYDYMIRIQDNDLFVKRYSALCDIINPDTCVPSVIETYFRAFGPGRKAVKPETDPKKADSDRLYTTLIKNAGFSDGKCLFECVITRGFRHQIRAHLAYAGFPICGDKLYNPNCGNENLCLKCTGFEFPLEDGSYFVY